jgi:hypothetical protein
LVPLLVAAACLLTLAVRHFPNDRTEDSEKLDASRAAMTFVKGRFGAEIVLRFAPIVVQHEGNRYVVNGWVEAIRRDGGRSATFDYTCDMLRNTEAIGACRSWTCRSSEAAVHTVPRISGCDPIEQLRNFGCEPV